MGKQIVKILLGLFVVSFCGGCTNKQMTEGTTVVLPAAYAQPDDGLRVNNGVIQFQSEDGTWKQLCTLEDIELAVERSRSYDQAAVVNTQGLKGDKGDTGPVGPKGDKGDTGSVGPTGPAGPAGETGSQGEKGDPGTPGKDGANGKDGTIVTVSEEGELILDGVGTGYYLSKKEDQNKDKIDAPKHLSINNGTGQKNGGYYWNVSWDVDYQAAYYEVQIEGKSYFTTSAQYNFLEDEYPLGKEHTVTVVSHPFSESLTTNSSSVTGSPKCSLFHQSGLYLRAEIDTDGIATAYLETIPHAALYTLELNGQSNSFETPVFTLTNLTIGENYDCILTVEPDDKDKYISFSENYIIYTVPSSDWPYEPTPDPEPMPTPTPIPTSAPVICWDGSEARDDASCPGYVTCWDGSLANNEQSCPVEPEPDENDWPPEDSWDE